MPRFSRAHCRATTTTTTTPFFEHYKQCARTRALANTSGKASTATITAARRAHTVTGALARARRTSLYHSLSVGRTVGRARTHANTHTHTLTRTMDGNVYGKREWQTFVRTRLRNTPKRARTVASSSGVVVYVVRAPSPRGVKTTRQGKNVTRRTAERYAHYCR